MRELSLQEKLDMQKSEVISRIMVVSQLKETLWNYHPDNPQGEDLVAAYNNLEQIIQNAEGELEELS